MTPKASYSITLRRLSGLCRMTEAYYAALSRDTKPRALARAYQLDEAYYRKMRQLLRHLADSPGLVASSDELEALTHHILNKVSEAYQLSSA